MNEQNTKPRVLIFSLSYFPLVGGAEIAVKEITDRSTNIDFEMITLSFSRDHKKIEQVGNITVHRIGGGLGYVSKILFVPLAAWYALKLSRTKRYDFFWAIMSFMLFPIVFMRFIGNKTPYLLTLQDGDPFEQVFNRWRIRFFMPLLRYGFSKAAVIQSISHDLATWAKRLGYKGSVQVVPNAVDVELFKPAKNKFILDHKLVVTTSRLVIKNGIDTLIQALVYLPKTVHLAIVGEGPERNRLEQLTTTLGLSSRVEFVGYVPHADMLTYLHHADVFARISRSEGLGNSFLEAMAVKVPVLGTPVGGIPDFLNQGQTGWLAEPDNPESVAQKISYILDPLNHEVVERVKNQAYELVHEKYTWSKIAREMNQIFKSFVK